MVSSSIEPFRGPGLDGEHFPPGAREAEYANVLLSRYKEVEFILLNVPARAQVRL